LRLRVPTVRVKGREIPRVLLGTSPFLGAGQFGVRAYEYYRAFFRQPENITRLVEGCIEMGVNGVQLVAYPQIGKAIRKAEENVGRRLIVVGSLPYDIPERALECLSEFKTVAALLHGEQTDKMDMNENRRWLRRIEREGYLTGVVTHSPSRTIPAILKELEFDILMLPLNKVGYLMGDRREELIDRIKESDVYVIAMKPLAAGRIKPEAAMKYLFSIGKVGSVAVGVASIEEAKETFSSAIKALTEST